MKKTFYSFTTTLLLIAIGLLLTFSHSQAAQLKVNIKPYKNMKESEFALCMGRAGSGDGYHDAFDTMYLSKTGHFEVNDIQKGRYQIAIMHPSSDILPYNIYFTDNNSVVEMDVELDRITLPEKIDSTRIVGDFNGWDFSESYLKMKYDAKKKHWYLPENDMKKFSGIYYFVVNEYTKKHSPELPIAPKKSAWADYQNLNKPETDKIIFVPGKFKQGQPNHNVIISGNDKDYSMIYDSLDSIIDDLRNHFSNALDKKETLEDYKVLYNKAELRLLHFKGKYNNSFQWLFPEVLFQLYDYSPVQIERYLGRNNPVEYKKITTGSDYLTSIRNKALILKEIKNPGLAITPELISSINYFPHYLSSYDLYNELDIPYGYIENMLDQLLNESSNQELCAWIEYYRINMIAYYRPDKIKGLYLDIKKRYPKSSLVKDGHVDKELKSLSITAGLEAPDFKLKALDGKEIELSSLRGKYVFLDFWGTWCAPCREEIPNIKEMHETISPDELVIIGIAHNDTEEKVNKYLSANDVKYINVMSTDDVISDYGVNSFPTTFLIDKEGKIVSKDLRGKNLADTVKELMK